MARFQYLEASHYLCIVGNSVERVTDLIPAYIYLSQPSIVFKSLYLFNLITIDYKPLKAHARPQSLYFFKLVHAYIKHTQIIEA